MKKKKILFVLPFFMLLVFGSCSDDATHPRKITSVKYVRSISSYGEVLIRWINPTTTELSYITISYVGEDGKEQLMKISEWDGDPTSSISEGIAAIAFDDQEEREFTVTAYTRYDIASDPIVITGKALPTIANAMLETVEIYPYINSVALHWGNEFEAKGEISVTYIDGGGKEITEKVISSPEGRFIITKAPAIDTKYTIFIVDEKDRVSSFKKDFTAKPIEDLNIKKLDRTAWNLVEISSEEPRGEGVHRGYAKNAIDGNLSTYWHTLYTDEDGVNRYPTSFARYPHILVIDMKEVVVLTTISMIKRRNNSDAHKKFKILTSYDNKYWMDCGEFINEMSRPNDVEQMSDLATKPIGRYFKFMTTEAVSPATLHTHIAEIYAYGIPACDIR